MIDEVACFVTRECNLKCKFCKVRQIKRSRTLLSDEWFEIFKKIKEFNPKIVVIYGGEPLLRKDIFDILDGLNDVNLPYTLISNSTLLDENVAKKLVDHGLESFTASIDFPFAFNDFRSRHSWKALNIMKSLGVKDVTGNIIVYRKNYRYVPMLVDELNARGMWSIVGLCQFPRDENDNIFSYRCWDEDNVFREEDVKGLKKVSNKLVDMKDEGFLIHNVHTYLERFSYFASPKNRFLWHCSEPCYMTIDEDGTLMACPDIRGNVEKLNLLELDLAEYEKVWYSDVSKCPGCFYNHQFQAEAGGVIKH